MTDERDQAADHDPTLVNPYHQDVPGGSADRLARSVVLRRTLLQIIVVVLGIALIGGTVAVSCGVPASPTVGTPAR